MSFIINYKVTQQLFLMYCLVGFSISEQTDVAFFWYEYLRIYMYVRQNEIMGYRFLISKILIHPLPERIQKVQIVFSHAVRRDTLWLRWYDYLQCQIVDPLCNIFLFCAHFPPTKLLTKIGFFVIRKGPGTHVIVYSSFVKQRIDARKLESSARIQAIEC